ncbi:hypothetical protein CUMW_098400 [Citrus unshiu]|uniref:NADPH oxidase Respiratory burst domain-containing protein n=1 Tax=Citrus unshiu TaxID=55188 RepID=A0A2H5P2L4_CITUN|nr:hypothetical protein CUMW_098400 [Citrus unshiu]
MWSLSNYSRTNNQLEQAQDLVELTIELEDDAVLRQKFGWLRSGSSPDIEERTMSARDERRIKAKLQRTRSGAKRALNGLRFISKAAGASDAEELRRLVESTFKSLSEDGLLAREDFGECIGMVDSKEFAVGIFDALARRRGQKIGKITKEELREFWLQISDQSFDARLQIFFDMYVIRLIPPDFNPLLSRELEPLPTTRKI